MVDKLSTLPRSKISAPFGRLDDERMKAVDRAFLLVVGLISRTGEWSSDLSGTMMTIVQRSLKSARSGTRRSVDHTSELQSLMRDSYAIFCLSKKQCKAITTHTIR